MKVDQIFYADVTADVQAVVYALIEENTVGLVIDAMSGCVMIVEVAVVIAQSVKRVILPVFTVKRLGVINAFVMYVANVLYRCVQSAKDHQIFYVDVTVDVQSVVYVSIEENMVLLVINAMIGYVVIVEVAVVMKIHPMLKIMTMMINKLTLKRTNFV